jgi:hypothetical protein
VRRFLSIYVATYRPLCSSKAGRAAIAAHGLPAYIDSSCRREPDFESPFPGISAICRAGNFAPRLNEGDRIAYTTVRGRYGSQLPHWRLTALLQVRRRFETHEAAAAWYSASSVPPPQNCFVAGTSPYPWDYTGGQLAGELRLRCRDLPPERRVQLWDATYRSRVKRWPVYLACEALFVALQDPPALTDSDWRACFGKRPATRNPQSLPEAVWLYLIAKCAAYAG